jgi:hypothetical protein
MLSVLWIGFLFVCLFVVDAFDTEQLLECMKKLISGQRVKIPIYDFKKHQRSSDSFRQVYSVDYVLCLYSILTLPLLGHLFF